MSKNMELKVYKELAKIYSSLFWGVKQRAMTCVEYQKDKPDEIFKEMEYISNPDKWEYCGLLNKEQKGVLEVLEYLIDDEMKEIFKYREWRPTER